MRVGLTGLGSIGRRHAANLLALGCEVVAMDVSREARDAAAARLPLMQVSDSLNFTDLDALVIATPAEHHLLWVEEAIRRQTPFFVEKPLGTLEQLPRWREIAAMTLPVTHVGFMLRFNPQWQALRALVKWPETAGFRCLCDWRQWPGTYKDGLLECAHEIDLALVDCPSSEVFSVERTDHAVSIKLWNRRVDLDWEAPEYFREWERHSSRASASVWFDDPAQLGDQMYRDEMKHFIECARLGLPTLCDLHDGLRVLEVCQQVEQMTKAVA